jgi:hypothetical protein
MVVGDLFLFFFLSRPLSFLLMQILLLPYSPLPAPHSHPSALASPATSLPPRVQAEGRERDRRRMC